MVHADEAGLVELVAEACLAQRVEVDGVDVDVLLRRRADGSLRLVRVEDAIADAEKFFR